MVQSLTLNGIADPSPLAVHSSGGSYSVDHAAV